MNGKWPPALICLGVYVLLGFAVFAAHSRAMKAEFFFDDYPSIIDNWTIRQLFPLSGPLQPPAPSGVAGRPVVNLSFAVNYLIGELNPAGYRLVNMTLHAVSAMLLFSLVRRTLKLDHFQWLDAAGDRDRTSTTLALAVALLWAVHPLQTETVSYVTQRTELAMGLCYLATLYLSLRYFQSQSSGARVFWLASAALTCLTGMASKEVMVTAPLVVLLYHRSFIADSFSNAIRTSWPLYLGLSLSWLLLAYLNVGLPRAQSAGFHLGVSVFFWWLTQTEVIVMYLRLVFWPWPLSIHYELPLFTTIREVWPYLLSVALLLLATLVGLWRNSALGFLGASFFLILAPTSVVPIITEMAAERRMYLPLAAVIALVVVGAARLVLAGSRTAGGVFRDRQKSWAPRVILIAAAILAMVLGSVSYARLASYRTEISLWQETAVRQPQSDRVQLNLAVALDNAGRLDEAAKHYHTAVTLNPDNPEFRSKYGVCLTKMGRFPQALEQFERGLVLNSDDAKTHYNLGIVLKSMGQIEAANEHFAESVQLRPSDAEFRNNYGNTLRLLGRFDEARRQLEAALQLKPDMPEARFNLALTHSALGGALFAQGKHDDAIEHFQKAVELKPDLADFRNNLGAALIELGRIPEAIVELDQAVRLAPKSAAARFNLAEAYKKTGRAPDARAQAQRALDLANETGQADLTKEIEEWLNTFEQSPIVPPTTSEATKPAE